jgi:hypothetical protein
MGAVLTFSHTLQHWVFGDKVLLLLIPFFYFLLEPVRAGWLYYLSRKY